MAGSPSLFAHDLPAGFHYRDNVITNLEERALLSGLEGAVYTTATEEQVETRLTDRLRNGGHPYARAQVESRIDRATGAVRITVQVEPGPSALTGDLRIDKPGRTRKGYVEGRDLRVMVAAGAAHNEAAWGRRIKKAIPFLLGA